MAQNVVGVVLILVVVLFSGFGFQPLCFEKDDQDCPFSVRP